MNQTRNIFYTYVNKSHNAFSRISHCRKKLGRLGVSIADGDIFIDKEKEHKGKRINLYVIREMVTLQSVNLYVSSLEALGTTSAEISDHLVYLAKHVKKLHIIGGSLVINRVAQRTNKGGRPRKVGFSDLFIQQYDLWMKGKITAVQAYNACGISDATFYREVKRYRESMQKSSQERNVG